MACPSIWGTKKVCYGPTFTDFSITDYIFIAKNPTITIDFFIPIAIMSNEQVIFQAFC